MKIVVLGGGISTERHVSLVTATSVCKALRSLGHKAIFVDMFLGLENYEGNLDDAFDVADGFCATVSIEHNAPNIDLVINERFDKSNSRFGKNVLEICKLADCVFLGLHGIDGEDGKIQAALDLIGVPYTGSGVLGSAIGMNKSICKQLMICNNIPTPPYTDHAPCVVKEVDGGSSLGTWICDTEDEYQKALLSAKKEIIVEKKIVGREFTVPIFDDRALDVIEIVASNGNFDYISKYQGGDEAAKEICPAPIDDSVKTLLQSLAMKLFKILDLKVYARIDFLLDNDGNAYCLEVNTLPGMTPASLIPKAAKIAGYDYPHLCEKIIQLSMK